MNILIADDSKPIRTMLRALLEEKEHHVTEVTNGADALKVLTGSTPPDLALLDWNMPELDGIDACRQFRQLPSGERPHYVYIIMLTSRSERSHMLEGLRAGADDYMSKPFDHEELIVRVEVGERCIRLQRVLAHRVRELERANQELEAFSRSVSHDLKSPLSSIIGLVEMLTQEGDAKIDPESRTSLNFVLKSARRMNEIIADLFTLSKATRAELQLDDVRVDHVANEILSDLARQDSSRVVRAIVGGCDPVLGDKRLVKIALENLLRNAWKFTGRTDNACIEVGTEKRDGETIYYVRDNGAGFDMKYASKLFGVFQRLHNESEFPGTGIGLTIVQRIIERHGGRVWANATPGKGATFWFTVGTPLTASVPVISSDTEAYRNARRLTERSKAA